LRLTATPKQKVLGTRLKKKYQELDAAIRALHHDQLTELQISKSMIVLGERIAVDEIEVVWQFSADTSHLQDASNGELLVVLDVTPDLSLIEEGMARELVNRVQKLRKEAGLLSGDSAEFVYDLIPPPQPQYSKPSNGPGYVSRAGLALAAAAAAARGAVPIPAAPRPGPAASVTVLTLGADDMKRRGPATSPSRSAIKSATVAKSGKTKTSVAVVENKTEKSAVDETKKQGKRALRKEDRKRVSEAKKKRDAHVGSSSSKSMFEQPIVPSLTQVITNMSLYINRAIRRPLVNVRDDGRLALSRASPLVMATQDTQIEGQWIRLWIVRAGSVRNTKSSDSSASLSSSLSSSSLLIAEHRCPWCADL